MFPNPDDDDSMSVRLTRSWRWIVAFGLVCVLGALPWWLRETGTNRNLTPAGINVRAGTATTAGAVGTSGLVSDVREAAVDSGIIRELETLTGSFDGHELVGRRISLALSVQEQANDNAFWIGSGKNRVLVVMHRDRRDDAQRQEGAVAPNGIAPWHHGQTATIIGTIQRIPSSEEMASWGLTTRDKMELAGRPIYIRADTVRAEPST
jgi:hypothetical protein